MHILYYFINYIIIKYTDLDICILKNKKLKYFERIYESTEKC